MATEPPKGYHRIVRLLEASEIVLYGAVAVLLIIIAIMSLIGVVANFTLPVENSAILGLQDLFTTIIILELLMTVVGYIKRKSINLGLLIGVGLTAMIRKIITVGYSSLSYQEFALVLLATAILVAAIIFVGDRTIKA